MLSLVIFTVFVLAMADAGLVTKKEEDSCVEAEMYKVEFPDKTVYKKGDTAVYKYRFYREIIELKKNTRCIIRENPPTCTCDDDHAVLVAQDKHFALEGYDFKGDDEDMEGIGAVETYTQGWQVVIHKKVTKAGCVLVYRAKKHYSLFHSLMVATGPPVLSLTEDELEYFKKPDSCPDEYASADRHNLF